MLASGTTIPNSGKATMDDYSLVIRNSDKDCRVPITIEVFNLEEGIDLILGMSWLRAYATGISWENSDQILLRPEVGLVASIDQIDA